VRDDAPDPYLGCNFLVEIDGIVVAGFKECSGLSVEVEVETYKEGGVEFTEHKLPKGAKYTNLVLKKGLTDSTELWDWFTDVVGGKVERRGVNVVLRGADGSEVKRWGFIDAYPVKWTGPDLNADSAAVGIESIEFVHMGLTEF
jgi:phage tail-like protein